MTAQPYACGGSCGFSFSDNKDSCILGLTITSITTFILISEFLLVLMAVNNRNL